ncbi:MAG: hypothetical protein D6741_18605 [Planctomycetota bacterium]|nr:MAG: hypothetical protein D6741_18605 [Planctomycetota bacterium]
MSESTPSHVPQSYRWRRHAIGILGLILLAGGCWFWIFPPEGNFQATLEAACWRGGSLALVVWVGFYEIVRLPTWILLAAPIVLAIAVYRPRLLLALVPVFLLIAIFRPRKKKGGERRTTASRSRRRRKIR